MTILLIFAFLAGIVTVLSPCILPVLPIVLSGSVGEGKKRPLGIIAGFITSFTFFTLFLSTIVTRTGISADALRTFSVLVVIVFGLSLLIPAFTKQLEKLFTLFSRFGPSSQAHGFGGGFAIGLSLGLVWTPCVGPILASVISLAITGTVTGSAFLITLAYAIGTGLPMLAITYGGRNLLQKSPWLLQNTQKIQKGFGVVMIATGLAIFFNVDRTFQTWVLEKFPSYGVGLTRFEDNELVKSQLEELNSNPKEDDMGKPLFDVQEEANYPTAPELIGGTNWLNSEPLTLEDDLRGKVVLIDFWTYSCINCIRTFPYVTSWYEKYKDSDFVIVGVHSPEFEFEKNPDNVTAAMEEYGITYPVVQDNDFKIWRAYNNRYWPAHYLIDKNGKIRYTHFGEGKYQETENKIRELLGEEPISEGVGESALSQFTSRRFQTQETYLGYLRAESYTTQNQIETDKEKDYQLSRDLPEDAVGLSGNWTVADEYVEAGTPSETEEMPSLTLNFQAQKVHLVMDAPEQAKSSGSAYVEVLLDGQPLNQKYWTQDMDEKGRIQIEAAKKYDILDLGEDYGRHLVTLKFSPGIQAFAFTFGS